MDVPPLIELAAGLDRIGITAFTTTRAAGDFNWRSREPAAELLQRWTGLAERCPGGAPRIACAPQVHGCNVLVHDASWRGLLRATEADGHFSNDPGTVMAVTLADCVPIFLGHPAGAAAILHSGWKGTEGNIAAGGVRRFTEVGLRAADLVAHCGPAICGDCYEVGPEVFRRLTGRDVDRPANVDLRAIIAGQLAEAGVREISISSDCTRCDNSRFFSHRCGDIGRQVGVIATPPSAPTTAP